MQIVNLEQGSQEWLEFRLGMATASNFDNLITSTGKESTSLEKYALKLASEKLLINPEPSYKNEAMQRGNELEPLARERYQQFTLSSVDQVGMIVSDCGNYGYSPDGLVGEDGLIEIKCPMAPNHIKNLLSKQVPSEYYAQCQGGLFLSNKKWIDFISYHPDFKEPNDLLIIRLERDEEFIIKLSNLIDKVIIKRNEILNQLKN